MRKLVLCLLNNKGTDQPVLSVINAFVISCLDSEITEVAACTKPGLSGTDKVGI